MELEDIRRGYKSFYRKYTGATPASLDNLDQYTVLQNLIMKMNIPSVTRFFQLVEKTHNMNKGVPTPIQLSSSKFYNKLQYRVQLQRDHGWDKPDEDDLTMHQKLDLQYGTGQWPFQLAQQEWKYAEPLLLWCLNNPQSIVLPELRNRFPTPLGHYAESCWVISLLVLIAGEEYTSAKFFTAGMLELDKFAEKEGIIDSLGYSYEALRTNYEKHKSALICPSQLPLPSR